MRKFTAAMALGLAACLAVSASATTVVFDFGDASSSTAGVNTFDATQSLDNAVDTNGDTTSIDLNNTSGNFWSPNSTGTNTPGGDAAAVFGSYGSGGINQLTNDSLTCNGCAPVYAITGLEPNTAYDYTFFASRDGSGEIREASYDVDGNIDLLDAFGNTDNIAQLLGVVSNGNGEATLSIQNGPNTDSGWLYLGAFQINTSVPEPSSIFLLAMGGLGLVAKRRK